MNALKLFMKKNKGKIGKFLGDVADTGKAVGKTAKVAAKNPHGAASLVAKGADKAIAKNPKTAAALAAAGTYAATSDKKKKKRPYETDED